MTTPAPFQQIELNRLAPSRGTVKLASVVVMVSIVFFLCAVAFVRTLLIVEDHPEVRRLAADTLAGFGYSVTEAHDAESAVALLESGRHFDLLFSDVMMPGPVKTTTMAGRATQLLPNLVILYTSGYIESVIGEMGTLDRDVHLLSKPYTSAALASTIRERLEQRT